MVPKRARGARTTSVASLVDTNVLVYRHDPRFPQKQQQATDLLRCGIENGSLRIPHQAIVEFVAAVTRSPGGAPPLLSLDDARREAEELLNQFPVLYPDEGGSAHSPARSGGLSTFLVRRSRVGLRRV